MNAPEAMARSAKATPNSGLKKVTTPNTATVPALKLPMAMKSLCFSAAVLSLAARLPGGISFPTTAGKDVK